MANDTPVEFSTGQRELAVAALHRIKISLIVENRHGFNRMPKWLKYCPDWVRTSALKSDFNGFSKGQTS